jgi:hypothetical protein
MFHETHAGFYMPSRKSISHPNENFFPYLKTSFRFKFGRRKDNLVGTAGLGNDALELIDLLLGTAKGTELLMLLV